MAQPSERPSVVLGVSGGIAAYKACSLVRLFTESGHAVRVVPTAAALEFVGAATWAALSGQPVHATVWEDVHDVPHVRLGQGADLVVVAPATADLLARAAHGHADDLLTSVLLTARCPVLMAPAMHTEMWQSPATGANVALLRSRGVVVLDPARGRLTGADTGPGRLPDPEEIFAAAVRLLARGATGPDLAGRSVVVSAGGTREPLDPVRFLGNASSGRQGFALAASAAARGARVTLVAANCALPAPAGVDVVPVGSARQLQEAVVAAAKDADAVVMAAAVADFRPAEVTNHKIKKSFAPGAEDDAPVVRLVRNPDILAGLVAERAAGRLGAPVIVGFAAETGDDSGDVLHHARAKLARKGCDLLVVNDVSDGKVFGADRNTVTLLRPDGTAAPVAEADKAEIADAVWDAVASLAGWLSGEDPCRTPASGR
ncbi:MAG: phosphopantothenoylcysteine decarboxylase / phosphopantothenate---cysteine ligase [Actinomycetota bacterium]|nr:phosphopantothenoylcysteine decarboxylase / phosphopantothenate---cysteine ligase [Actinomycetota bacterium]